MMGDLQKGDVVWLKSGGPKMTVADEPVNTRGWKCIWFLGDKQIEGFFPLESLTTTNPDEADISEARILGNVD
jgi:uncharacterized protein YodC (DUF2158 family)